VHVHSNRNQKGVGEIWYGLRLEGISCQDCWPFILVDKTIFSLHHIEGITLDAGEQVDEVAGGASSMGVDRIDEVGDWASEGQAAGLYGVHFTAGSLAGKGVRDGTRGTG
jgi:hypothetical protein